MSSPVSRRSLTVTLSVSGSGVVNVSGVGIIVSGLALMGCSGHTHTWMRLLSSGTGTVENSSGSRRLLSMNSLRLLEAGYSG